jgi:hypothetical protein
MCGRSRCQQGHTCCGAPALLAIMISMDNITLLIADDEPAFRSGLRALLKSVNNLTLVGEAATGS